MWREGTGITGLSILNNLKLKVESEWVKYGRQDEILRKEVDSKNIDIQVTLNCEVWHRIT